MGQSFRMPREQMILRFLGAVIVGWDGQPVFFMEGKNQLRQFLGINAKPQFAVQKVGGVLRQRRFVDVVNGLVERFDVEQRLSLTRAA
jgi:hypothetical protein